LRKSGILNPALLHALAKLGHTDRICIADAGLPIPDGVERIDLSIVLGLPSIESVISAIAAECIVQKTIYAQEADSKNVKFASKLDDLWPDVPKQKISHEDFKKLVRGCRFVIRTGEANAYANVILESGVPF
jgi:D-ribose pyranase